MFLFYCRRQTKYPEFHRMPAMMMNEAERGGTKKHIRIRADAQDIPPHLPPTQQRNIRFSQRPSSAHNPSTQPLPFLKLRRWRPLSAGGNTTQHSFQARGSIRETQVPKPPVKSNQKPTESKSKRELTLSERNYKKSRLMKFTYPTQMHNWVGPQPNEVPSMLKRSVPRCLQRGYYYARLPQRYACHYAPWKSITHVNRHHFTSFSLPHPRNKKEQEALEVKAKNTPRTPRHVVKESDTDNDGETAENVLELVPSADNNDDDQNVSKNGSYHYVYEESDTNQAKGPNEEAHSVKSARSEEYEYQEIPNNRKKDENDTDDYDNNFDKEEHRNGNGSDNSDKGGVNSDIDDDTDNNNEEKSSSRRSSKISNGSSKGRRRDGRIDDDIDSEAKSIAVEEEPTSRRSSRVSVHSSRGRRDSSNESIIDEVESTKAKDATKTRVSIASEEEIVEDDETNKSAKPESKGRISSSEAESVGSDDDEDTKKRKHIRPNASNKSKSSVRSNGSGSESDEEKELDTERKTAVSGRKSSASSNRKRSITSQQSQQSTTDSRKNSISKRKGSVSTRKSSIVSERKDSITSQNSYVASSSHEALQSRKSSTTSNRKDSVVSQKSDACSQKDSASRRSVDSDRENKR